MSPMHTCIPGHTCLPGHNLGAGGVRPQGATASRGTSGAGGSPAPPAGCSLPPSFAALLTRGPSLRGTVTSSAGRPAENREAAGLKGPLAPTLVPGLGGSRGTAQGPGEGLAPLRGPPHPLGSGRRPCPAAQAGRWGVVPGDTASAGPAPGDTRPSSGVWGHFPGGRFHQGSQRRGPDIGGAGGADTARACTSPPCGTSPRCPHGPAGQLWQEGGRRRGSGSLGGPRGRGGSRSLGGGRKWCGSWFPPALPRPVSQLGHRPMAARLDAPITVLKALSGLPPGRPHSPARTRTVWLCQEGPGSPWDQLVPPREKPVGVPPPGRDP